jgi:hypothetical protein
LAAVRAPFVGSLVAAPAEVLAALRVLPRLLAQIERITESTASLPRMEAAISKVADDASTLPAMHDSMATIEGAMPTLVDVQRRLADLPRTMDHLEGEMGGLGETPPRRPRVSAGALGRWSLRGASERRAGKAAGPRDPSGGLEVLGSAGPRRSDGLRSARRARRFGAGAGSTS